MRPLIYRLSCIRSTRICLHQTSSRALSVWRFADVFKNLFPKLEPVKDASLPSKHQRMDIRKDSFATEAVRLLQDIADSHFIAFDFEFSGIAERNRDRAGKANIEERYEETRASVQEFQPLQIGLTIVKFDEAKSRYVLEPYNLNISPLPTLRERQFTRKWSMSSGAITFLHRNGFDFHKQMVHGVPYLSLQEEAQARSKMTADTKREDLTFKPADQVLLQHVRKTIALWQGVPKNLQDEYVNIPNGQPPGVPLQLNGYQRRLVHQVVQNEYPAMKTTSMGHFIQITNPSSQQQASQEELERQHRDREIGRAIGFRWIIDGIIGRDLSKLPEEYLLPALSQTAKAGDGDVPVKRFLEGIVQKLQARRKILVGHNCLTDVMFLYKMAVGDLPATLNEFKDKINEMFPAIIDTKYLSNCFSEKHGRLSLGEVAEDLSSDAVVVPEMHTSREFDRYANSTYLHEAGYDSYITAIVAIKMAAKLHRDGSQRRKEEERQKQEVVHNTEAEASNEFGVQEGYVTATESLDSTSEISSSSSHPDKQIVDNAVASVSSSSTHSRYDSIASTASDLSNASNNTSTPSTSSVIAVKTRASPEKPASVDWKDESQVAALRSAFASQSIYDTFNASSSMPGDETPNAQLNNAREAEDPAAKIDRLVKEGRLMPRWHQEGAFWEFYGNKLQCNGTIEGVLNIVD